jgi:predicted O-linked N-acetylglucosamine transferase (SPINDLY family)
VLKTALALHQNGQLAEAAALYRDILTKNPKNADVLHLLGVIEFQKGNPSEAVALIDRAIKFSPHNAAFFCNRGNALKNLERLDDAVASYDRALAIRSDYAEAHYNRGVTLQQMKRFGDALASYDRALSIRPDHAEALNNRGAALSALKRFDEALASYDRALAIKPNAEALINRGAVLGELKRFADALASYDRALAIQPDIAEALNNRGLALQALKRFAEALASYDRAAAIRPNYAEALYNRGSTLTELKRFDEALVSYDRAFAADPDLDFLLGDRLYCRLTVCDWHGLAEDFAQLAKNLEARKKASKPFTVIATPLSAALQRSCAETYVGERHKRSLLLPQFKNPYRHDRIRLGYFSADFRNHATAYLAAGLFECHDRAGFETIAVSFAAPVDDPMRTRLGKAFEHFIDAGAISDKDIALLARNMEIDIAIDLNGLTHGNRLDVFALGVAPVQVSYLGYPGTTGADYMDYLIADSTLIPDSQRQYYSEKLVYLPDSYQVNDSKRSLANKQFTRAECGLPEQGFVFCSFNNNYKITPEIFDIWMRLLKAADGSVLWLLEDNATAANNLRKEARSRGVSPERLVFAARIESSEHLARQRLADVFLDTLPCNAHTTASDALWAGLPIVTCLGDTFAGRVAASLLNAVGLAELIAPDLRAYEALAGKLAANPQWLLSLRQKLADHRLTYPLFDTPRFTRHLESAYVAMWKRHQAGLPPEHIFVPSAPNPHVKMPPSP